MPGGVRRRCVPGLMSVVFLLSLPLHQPGLPSSKGQSPSAQRAIRPVDNHGTQCCIRMRPAIPDAMFSSMLATTNKRIYF
jgi:hypothetical protein